MPTTRPSYFKWLDAAYPSSKFILTIRPLPDWLLSRKRHVERNLKNPDYKGGFRKVDIEGWTRHYLDYREETRRHFEGRDADFLIIDIPSGEGWDKLCKFPSLPVPAERFPWGNKSEHG